MRPLIILAGITSTAILVSTLNQPDLSIPFGSPQERILRYAVKMEHNKDASSWRTSKAVTRAKTGNSIDIEKVKTIFAQQDILSNKEFETALQDLYQHDLLQPQTLTPTIKGITTYQAIMAQYTIDRSPPPDTHATTTSDILNP